MSILKVFVRRFPTMSFIICTVVFALISYVIGHIFLEQIPIAPIMMKELAASIGSIGGIVGFGLVGYFILKVC